MEIICIIKKLLIKMKINKCNNFLQSNLGWQIYLKIKLLKLYHQLQHKMLKIKIIKSCLKNNKINNIYKMNKQMQ